MELKKIVVLALVLFIISSSHLEGVKSDALDCYDACSTSCVGRETREMQRCDRKCSIKCGPDADLQAKGHQR